MNTLIYINDELVDLYPGTIVATTFKAFEIGGITSRSSSYTNRFKLPKTARNRRIFGFADNPASTSAVPYSNLRCKVVQDGIEIIPDGAAFMENSDDYFDLSIYYNGYDFFKAIGDQLLTDLPTASYDYYPGNTDTIIKQPFIQYGKLNEALDPLPFSGLEYYSCSYKRLIELIIENAGYTKSGDIFSDSKLGALYIAGLGFEGYQQSYIDSLEFDVYRDTSAVFNASSTETKINFTEIVKNGGFYDGANTYKVEDPLGGAFGGAYFLFDAFALLDIEVSLAGGASGLDIKLTSGTGEYLRAGVGSGVYEFEISEYTKGSQATLNGSIAGQEGTELYMTIRTSFGIGTATVTFNKARMYNRVRKDLFPSYVPVKGLLPELKQLDLLRDFAIRFGILFQERNKTLFCKTIEAIISDRSNAVDWTSKRDLSKQEAIDFNFGNLSQNNYFEYVSDDDLTHDRTGQGNLHIADDKLPMGDTFYTSIFNSSNTRRIGNPSAGYVKAAEIPIIEIKLESVSKYIGSCVAATTGNITLAGGQVIDKIYCQDGDQVLVKDQTNPAENGVYLVRQTQTIESGGNLYNTPNSWLRVKNADSIEELEGAIVSIENYTEDADGNPDSNVNGGKIFKQINKINTLGGSPIEWELSINSEEIHRIAEESNDPGLRLIMVRDKEDSEPVLSGGISDYEVGYFLDEEQSQDCGWPTFINAYYKNLGIALQKAKTITRYYKLTAMDIASLDLFKLVYDDGVYFLINTVENFVPGQATKVTLFKVS